MEQNIFDEELMTIISGCEEYQDIEIVTPVKIDLPAELNGDVSQYSLEELLDCESKTHNSQVQFLIAEQYKKEENWEECYIWAKKSALQNNPDGIARVAFMFHFGLAGFQKDLEIASKLYKKSACLGSAIGQCNLGIIYDKNGDSETAVKWWKLSAEQGNAAGQYNLGDYYYSIEDFDNAFIWLEKSAEQGFPKAQCHLGYMYYDGIGTEENIEEAVKWWKLSAEQGNKDAAEGLCFINANNGDPEAMYAVGKIYDNKYNHEEAINWFIEAANKGNANAQYELYKAYNTGWDVPKNSKKAKKWLKKSLKAGVSDAQYEMGELLYDKKRTKSLKWYKKAANQGHIDSLIFLGNYYNNNDEPKIAVEYWTKAAELGDAEAQNNVGKCYYEGNGVEKDFTEAVKWCRMAAEQGDGMGMYNLAWSYDKGTGVEQNYLEAAKWYELSAEEGHREAPINLGWLYENGLGVLQSFEDALNWYNHESADLFISKGFIEQLTDRLITARIKTEGIISEEQKTELLSLTLKELLKMEESNPDTLIEFIISEKYFEAKDFKNAYEWIKKSAEKGFAAAQYNLGLCYYLALGVRLDNEEAVKWFTMAANQGNLEAQLVLNDCHWKGIGVPENREEASKWLKKAAEQGDSFALYSYGMRLLDGNGIEGDVTEGGNLIVKAAELGYIDAQWALGNGYDSGKHYEEAIKYYRMVAEQGRSEGQYKLGNYYEFGKGVPKDKEEAKKWYKLAADQNDRYAKECYERCLYCEWDYDENMNLDDELKWMTIAAENGSLIGQCYFGRENKNSYDYEEAFKWYKKAADQGDAEGQYELGQLYLYGNGCERNEEKAVELFLMAAEQGNEWAMDLLSFCYKEGDGVPEDIEESIKWKKLKEEADDPNIKQIRRILRERY